MSGKSYPNCINYKRPIPPEFLGSFDDSQRNDFPLYCSRIIFKKPSEIFRQMKSFGIITLKPLEKLRLNEIYPSDGYSLLTNTSGVILKTNLEITVGKEITITANQLEILKKFHLNAFSFFVKSAKAKETFTSPNRNYLVAPLTKKLVCVNATVCKIRHEIDYSLAESFSKKLTDLNPLDLDSVLFEWGENGHKFFKVTKCDEISGQLKSLEGFTVDLSPRSLDSPPKTKTTPLIKIVIPLTNICYDAKTLVSFVDVPFILWRVEKHLTTKILCNFLPVKLKVDSLEKALTAPASNSIRNYERLEFVGDLVLKFVVSLSLFSNSVQKQIGEGELTRLRTEMVCNESLFLMAEKLTIDNGSILPQYIDKRGYQWRSFIPPGFSDCKFVNTGKHYPDPLVNQNLSLKIVADVMEAIIGVTFRTFKETSTSLALEKVFKLVIFFGFPLKLISLPNIDLTKELDVNLAMSLPKKSSVDPFKLSQLKIERSEGSLGYKFSTPNLVLNALAIGSNSAGEAQRMEFLGDALWDLIVYLCLLQKADEKHGADFLSKLKNEYTNNKFQSQIIQDLGMHCHLLNDNVKTNLSPISKPKIYADLFEALVCGVFLDSLQSFPNTIKVFGKFIK